MSAKNYAVFTVFIVVYSTPLRQKSIHHVEADDMNVFGRGFNIDFSYAPFLCIFLTSLNKFTTDAFSLIKRVNSDPADVSDLSPSLTSWILHHYETNDFSFCFRYQNLCIFALRSPTDNGFSSLSALLEWVYCQFNNLRIILNSVRSYYCCDFKPPPLV